MERCYLNVELCFWSHISGEWKMKCLLLCTQWHYWWFFLSSHTLLTFVDFLQYTTFLFKRKYWKERLYSVPVWAKARIVEFTNPRTVYLLFRLQKPVSFKNKSISSESLHSLFLLLEFIYLPPCPIITFGIFTSFILPFTCDFFYRRALCF